MTLSRLVPGVVAHLRRRPKTHRLRYRMFQLLLDLDELAELDARLKLFSVGRFNLISFHAADHLDPRGPSLRNQIEALLAASDVAIAGGPIRLLTMPRVLGHAFNPLSLYFCHRPAGDLAAVVYEVNNTFGERHLYVLPVGPLEAEAQILRQECEKRFFVSPFLPMALRYAFEVLCDAERVAVQVSVSDGDGEVMRASFGGRPEPLTDRALLRAWAGAPLLSFKVLGAIHWEALRLWRKGIGLQARRPTDGMGVTLGRAGEPGEPRAEHA